MRFGTKILLLTLAITVGLSGIVVLVVRNQITELETRRARTQINAAAQSYFRQLDERQHLTALKVRHEMTDPDSLARLDTFQLSPESDARKTSEERFSGYIFGNLLGPQLDSPTFQVLLDSSGKAVAVAVAPDDDKLKDALRQTNGSFWHIKDVLRNLDDSRHYLWLDGKLFLAFAVPLQQTRGEDPNFAYFCGYRISDEWLGGLLAKSTEQTDQRPVAIVTWFVIDGQIVARGSDERSELPHQGAQVAAMLGDKVIRTAPGQLASTQLDFDGDTLVAQYVAFEPAPNIRGVLVLASSLNEALAPLRTLQRKIALVTLFSLVLATSAARWMARRLARPVEELVEGSQRIGRGDFSTSIPTRRSDELGTLARSFNEMAAGLAQRDLIKDTLGQFVDPRVADALLTDPKSLRGRRMIQSVLFSDLEKFATLSEQLAPEQLVHLLNQYLGASADIVKGLNGYLDKFSGDGVVAFWGPPVEMNHSVAACRAALRMVELSKTFQDPPLRVRIGIATGEVIVGIIGSERSKKNYTAMGDVVNLASRIEGVNKLYGTQILIDASTAAQVNGQINTRKIDTVRVVGRSDPVELYEVIDGVEPSCLERYQQAMTLYASRQWSAAADLFAKIDDPPSRTMKARCEQFIETSPENNWDGVWNLEAK